MVCYSPGTPNTDASLETRSMPACCISAKGKKRDWGVGQRKAESSLVPGCIFLSLWFPSTVNVNKQSHERQKHGQNGGKKIRGAKRGDRKQSACKKKKKRKEKYLGTRHEIQVTSSILVALPEADKKHMQATNIWLPPVPSAQRRLYQCCGELSTHFNVNLSYNSCRTKLSSLRIKWFSRFQTRGLGPPSGSGLI